MCCFPWVNLKKKYGKSNLTTGSCYHFQTDLHNVVWKLSYFFLRLHNENDEIVLCPCEECIIAQEIFTIFSQLFACSNFEPKR